MRIIAGVYIAVALLLNQPAGRAQSANLQGAITAIDAMASAEFEKDRVGSITIGVVAGPRLVWTKSYGLADMEKKVAATRDSVYRIGSITKQFTALMLLQLVDEGKVRLSDPVETYFPEIRMVQDRYSHAPPITLVQLATMTSGLAREPADLPKYLVGPAAQWEKVLIAALPHTRYELEPDTQYLYSNIGYAILGAALSRAAATPYTTWVQQRTLSPLQMKNTAFEPNAAIADRLTKGYVVDRNGNVSFDAPLREHAGRGYKVPNGALYTTIDDLAQFVAFELGEGPESVLSKKTLEANYGRVNSSNGNLNSGYGIGFTLTRRGADVFLGHGGSVAGYTAHASVHRASKTGVIVLRNAGGGKFEMGTLTFRALAELAKIRQTN
ncbi:MAG TPA: serine hydrolase domain-containing protein [Vicinamibacterales bacterium]|nr:serine hydrolase domain-containing protein [Vicinamibacterales bacterium]